MRSRTPIQPIIGLSEVLKSKLMNNNSGNSSASNAENQEYVDVILRNGQRLGKLVEDVLDVTKIESQSLELHKEHFDLNDSLINIIDDIVRQRQNLWFLVWQTDASRKIM